jgi:hypothetical protein
MATSTGTLTELRLEPNGVSAWLAIPPAIRPAPGQYLSASSLDDLNPLPEALFPSVIEHDGIRLAAPLPGHWAAGMQLNLRGPLGKGFQMPSTTRRLALASLDDRPVRLMPLAMQALDANAAVVVYTRHALPELPEAVEVLPLDLLPEAPAWADFLALEAAVPTLPALRDRLGLKPFQRPACITQILVIAPMACHGMADCGTCAIHTRKGWTTACMDGPVFDFHVIAEG